MRSQRFWHTRVSRAWQASPFCQPRLQPRVALFLAEFGLERPETSANQDE